MASDSAKIENAHKATPATQSLNFTSRRAAHCIGIDCPWSEDDRTTFMPMARPTDENTYAQTLTWMKNRKSDIRWEVKHQDATHQPLARASALNPHRPPRQAGSVVAYATSPSHPPAFLACPIFDDQLHKPHKAFHVMPHCYWKLKDTNIACSKK